MAIRNVVVGIVYVKNAETKFLVLRRILLWKGWEFPKGGIEKSDATEESAMLRELAEETGLTNVRIIAKLPYEIKYAYPKGFSGRWKKRFNEELQYSGTVQSVFLIRSFSDDVKITKPEHGAKEHEEFRWLPYAEAKKLLTHTQQKRALDVAWKYLRERESGKEKD